MEFKFKEWFVGTQTTGLKSIFFLIIILFFIDRVAVFAQSKHGNEWITGRGSKVKFVNNIISTKYDAVTPWHYFTMGNSNICDTSGRLLLCSDGYNVYDSIGNYIDGGDTLVPKDYYISKNGFSISSQTSIFLPIDSDLYYFITPAMGDLRYADCLANNHCAFDLLLYNVIDMKANGGAGKVVKRMEILMEHAELSKTQMMACRHANGKDWWLLKQGSDSNKIYKFLFKQDTVENHGFQKFDTPVWGVWDLKGQSVFNQTGNKYATVVQGDTVKGQIFLADFDRCYGILTYPDTLHAPIISGHSPQDSTLLDMTYAGLAFSPDGSKLYAISQYNIFQYDFSDESWYQVAALDTTWAQFQLYNNAYLGPDNKLYIGNFNGLSKQMSVINNPDIKGSGCNFCPRCLRLDSLGLYAASGTPPCMPNYSLGAQVCWPLAISESNSEPKSMLALYPNPATDFIKIESSKKGKAQFILQDAQGKELLNNALLFIDGKQYLKLPNLANGLYSYKIKFTDEIFTGKLNILK